MSTNSSLSAFGVPTADLCMSNNRQFLAPLEKHSHQMDGKFYRNCFLCACPGSKILCERCIRQCDYGWDERGNIVAWSLAPIQELPEEEDLPFAGTAANLREIKTLESTHGTIDKVRKQWHKVTIFGASLTRTTEI